MYPLLASILSKLFKFYLAAQIDLAPHIPIVCSARTTPHRSTKVQSHAVARRCYRFSIHVFNYTLTRSLIAAPVCSQFECIKENIKLLSPRRYQPRRTYITITFRLSKPSRYGLLISLPFKNFWMQIV
ncbi:hypothetical protein PGTUg99_017854 [Puccinia graminis f. sp. tritici]|uniref:Uncharacterized protein n=1 Tax=Puccinia graminis f. sp. tritici TaxID=56615 RepID=A0A5B0RIH6_PUCGR|nr:hypothetical protein PGTUg99_017854 [Puccinia graminis f. sp. tritici]